MVEPGPTVLGGGGDVGGGGSGGGGGAAVVGAAVGGGAGACVEVVAASVVDVDVLAVESVTVVVVGSLRPASTSDVAVAAPSLESHAAAMNNIVIANAQIRLRIVKLPCHRA
jgi:hypothetical protein